MLGKHYSLGSKDELTGETRVKLANFDELRTQGDDIASFLNGFTPDPQYVYMHVIAMGASEYYGCNANGDYFPERDLINRHKTFETNAKVFREHDNKATSPSYGHVAFAWYNKKMHRVELILAIDKITGKEFVDRQGRGEQLEVSMGCKVAYDVCSICGNKAKKRSDYCDHIRYHKKEIFPDGKQPYMINYNPTFFDISIVRRRADKIAFVLAKVASVDNSLEAKYAGEFENLDQTCRIPEAPDPEEAVFDIDETTLEKAASEKELEPSYAEKVAMIKRVKAMAVKRVRDSLDKVMPDLEASEKDLPPALLQRLATRFPIPDILKSFALNAIPMKPREFTRIIIIQNNIPRDSVGALLNGFNHAKTIDFPRAEYRREIGDMLSPFIESRSSFLPAVLTRLGKILQREKTAATFSQEMYQQRVWLDPANGFRSDIPGYKGEIITVPNRDYGILSKNYGDPNIATDRLERELRRPYIDPKKKPIFDLGKYFGGLYLAARNPQKYFDLISHPFEASLLASIYAHYGLKNKVGDIYDYTRALTDLERLKKAIPEAPGTTSNIQFTLPFVGSHMFTKTSSDITYKDELDLFIPSIVDPIITKTASVYEEDLRHEYFGRLLDTLVTLY